MAIQAQYGTLMGNSYIRAPQIGQGLSSMLQLDFFIYLIGFLPFLLQLLILNILCPYSYQHLYLGEPICNGSGLIFLFYSSSTTHSRFFLPSDSPWPWLTVAVGTEYVPIYQNGRMSSAPKLMYQLQTRGHTQVCQASSLWAMQYTITDCVPFCAYCWTWS